jgi:hypothetical protein
LDDIIKVGENKGAMMVGRQKMMLKGSITICFSLRKNPYSIRFRRSGVVVVLRWSREV